MVGRGGNRQNLADRLDPIDLAMIVNERDHVFDRRSSSAWAKYAEALRRISLDCRSSRFSRSGAFILAVMSVDAPGRLPASISVFCTQWLSVCAVQPIFAATDVIAAKRPM